MQKSFDYVQAPEQKLLSIATYKLQLLVNCFSSEILLATAEGPAEVAMYYYRARGGAAQSSEYCSLPGPCRPPRT